MAYLLRVDLPDVPGALGAVATALGAAGADILAMDVVERSAGRAVDDMVVDIPGAPPDLLIAAAESVQGVRVESVLPDPGIAGARREWEMVEAMAADPRSALATLAEFLPEVVRVGWALVLRVDDEGRCDAVAQGGGAPDVDGLRAPILADLPRARRLPDDGDWVPDDWQAVATELAAAPVSTSLVLLTGRPGGPAMRDIEVARLAHLAGLAAAVSGLTDLPRRRRARPNHPA